MGAVTDATEAELVKLHADQTAPGLGELALSLARAIDGTDAPTAIAVAGRELRAVMADLRKLAPVGEEGDSVDDIAAQRAKRRAAAREQAAGG
ncbi:hypothetical protein ACFWMH_21995 [Streptomyces tendae]|uniref:hypothetical protein n=1 Tax=Streptomyces tendae TaxID=1932 RepID=UPI0019A2E6E3|nr:hypothetical protein [Streptomyces tendae]GHA61046.1 hypothetical protein GCM10010330_11140 [Streptomyces tendae]